MDKPVLRMQAASGRVSLIWHVLGMLRTQVSISGQALVFVVRTQGYSLFSRAGLWTYIAFFGAQVRPKPLPLVKPRALHACMGCSQALQQDLRRGCHKHYACFYWRYCTEWHCIQQKCACLSMHAALEWWWPRHSTICSSSSRSRSH